MSRHHSHLNTAVVLLTEYDGLLPFPQVLKGFFKSDRKYGSRDRRQIGQLCYSYFRAVRVVDAKLPIKEKVLIGYLLCASETDALIAALKPEWEPFAALTIKEKFQQFKLDIHTLFPEINHVEKEIEQVPFAYSHFSQPDLFLRLRPQKAERVKAQLHKAEIKYTELADDCLALPNSSKIEELLKLNKDAVVQDYASQRVGKLLELVKEGLPADTKPKVWDCCAASGGKSMLTADKLGDISLTVSDRRASILQNLKLRLQQANIPIDHSQKIDLTQHKKLDSLPAFDLVIADVPCTGSGTWSRTPEHLSYFDPREIDRYAKLQEEICAAVEPKIKLGGFFLYVTCSVYKQENSNIVNKILAKGRLELIESQTIIGYPYHSDTMYAALFRAR